MSYLLKSAWAIVCFCLLCAAVALVAHRTMHAPGRYQAVVDDTWTMLVDTSSGKIWALMPGTNGVKWVTLANSPK